MQLSAICNDFKILWNIISVNYSSWSAVFMDVHFNSPDKIVCSFAAGHSGSTLVSLMLGAHSHVFYAGEFHALPSWINEKKNCGCGRSILDCNFWQKVNREYGKVDFFYIQSSCQYIYVLKIVHLKDSCVRHREPSRIIVLAIHFFHL